MSEILYSSPSDAAFPYFMFLEQRLLPGHSDSAPHLECFLKLVRIVSGSGMWMVDRPYPLKAGDFMIFNNIEARALARVDGPDGMLIEQCVLLPTSLPPFLGCTDFFYLSRRAGRTLVGSGAPLYSELDACYRELSAEARGNSPRRDAMIYSLLVRLCTLFARNFDLWCGDAPEDARPSAAKSAPMSEIMCYIAENLASPGLDCASLASRFGYTRSRLAKEFSLYAGMSIAEYVRLMRIQNVILTLDRGSRNILDAALASGFNSSSGFYKTFRSITGTTPSEYLSEHSV